MNNNKQVFDKFKNSNTPRAKIIQAPQQQQIQKLTFDNLEEIKIVYINNDLWNIYYSTNKTLVPCEKECIKYYDNLNVTIFPSVGQIDVTTIIKKTSDNNTEKIEIPLLTLKDRDIISYEYDYKEGQEKINKMIIIVRC